MSSKGSITTILEEGYPNEHEVVKRLHPNAVLKAKRAYKTRLGLIEAHRFRSVTEEAEERLELLRLITDDARRRRKQDPGESRKDIYGLMVHQKQLEEQFSQLMERRNQLRGLSNKTKYQANQTELKKVMEQLHESTSSLVTNLKDQPTVLGNIAKIQKDRQSIQDLFKTTMDELKQQGFDTLVENVNYRLQQSRLLEETKKRQQETREALENLERDLQTEWLEFDRMVSVRNEKIAQLTKEAKDLAKLNHMTLKYEKDTAQSQLENLTRQRRNELTQLDLQITRVGVTNQKTEVMVHHLSKEYLEKRKESLDDLATAWDKKFNEELSNRVSELDILNEHRDKDKKELDKLRKRWLIDKADANERQVEMGRRKLEEETRQQVLKVMNLAQCKIRFHWRCHYRRKLREKKRKKKRKKKKKKQK